MKTIIAAPRTNRHIVIAADSVDHPAAAQATSGLAKLQPGHPHLSCCRYGVSLRQNLLF
jgi:hypothetical protein